jgi:hypothetical protein
MRGYRLNLLGRDSSSGWLFLRIRQASWSLSGRILLQLFNALKKLLVEGALLSEELDQLHVLFDEGGDLRLELQLLSDAEGAAV